MPKRIVDIVLPWPDPRLGINRRRSLHWAIVAKLIARAKSESFYLTRQEVGRIRAEEWPNGEYQKRVLLQWTFCPPNLRRRDEDNLISMLKPYQDGIAMAVGVDDSHFHLLELRHGERVKGGRIIATLTWFENGDVAETNRK